MENTKSDQQFCTILHTEAPKTGKKLKVEDAIQGTYEFRSLIVRQELFMQTYEISRGYSISFFIFSMMASLPSTILFTVGIITRSWQHLLFWGGILIIIWGLFIGIRKKRYAAFWASLVIGTLVWLLLLLQTIIRIEFVIENGGMERSDGYGSPLAFLIGLIGEQVFFVPLCFVAAVGWLNLLKRRKRTGNANA